VAGGMVDGRGGGERLQSRNFRGLADSPLFPKAFVRRPAQVT